MARNAWAIRLTDRCPWTQGHGVWRVTIRMSAVVGVLVRECIGALAVG